MSQLINKDATRWHDLELSDFRDLIYLTKLSRRHPHLASMLPPMDLDSINDIIEEKKENEEIQRYFQRLREENEKHKGELFFREDGSAYKLDFGTQINVDLCELCEIPNNAHVAFKDNAGNTHWLCDKHYNSDGKRLKEGLAPRTKGKQRDIDLVVKKSIHIQKISQVSLF